MLTPGVPQESCIHSVAHPGHYFALSPASIGARNGETVKGYRNYRRGQAAGALVGTPDGYAARCGVLTAELTSVLAGAYKLAATAPDTRKAARRESVMERAVGGVLWLGSVVSAS
jgi:hypothetical protein